MQCAVLGMVCVLITGFYAWSASSGMMELLGSGAQDSYYNLLVQGFRNGHLSVKREAPPELGDPSHFQWQQNYGLDDLSYYKGKLYLYFGVTPAVALFWPYAALTGHYLLHKDATVIFFSAGFLAGAGLLWAVWRRYFAETGAWVLAAGMLALGLANFTPAILGRCDVYEAAISCGYALTMLALGGIWCALQDGRRAWRWLAGASLAYGLAVGARPSLLLGGIILLAPVAQAWREQRRVWPLVVAAVCPMAAIGAGLMIYNALRFGNPLDFGQRYQLPLVVHRQFSLRYLWINFRVGFLDPARWSGHFPFVDDIAMPDWPKGYWQVDHAFGVLTNIPLVWLALAAPLAWRLGAVEGASKLRWFMGAVALLFGACALTLGLHDSMCLRYEMEYVTPLLLLAVVGVFAVERALTGRPAWRRAARCGWVLLLTFSVAFNLLASYKMHADTHHNYGFALLKTGKVDDAITQFQESLQMVSDYAEAHQYLGVAFQEKGREDDAIVHLQKALQLKPDYPDAHANLGNALLQEGRVDEAILHFQRGLQLKADLPEAHNSLGNALLQKGRVEEAITQFQEALEIKPDAVIARYCLAIALGRSGRLDEAITQYQEALRLQPDFAPAHHNLGTALLQQGKVQEAMAHLQKALEITPSDPGIQSDLALLLATAPEASLRNAGKALELARQANLLTGGENPFILRTLAAACAEAGRFAEAVETAQHALRLAEARSNTALAGTLQTELKFYQAGTPWRGLEQPQ
jgi:tetratricopeptide (TPR) repeat protein